MPLLPGYPPVHFDFGAIGELAGELAARGVKRPLIITDTGLVEHGVLDRVLAALPGNPDIAAHPPLGLFPGCRTEYIIAARAENRPWRIAGGADTMGSENTTGEGKCRYCRAIHRCISISGRSASSPGNSPRAA